jgi:hypothetical protein
MPKGHVWIKGRMRLIAGMKLYNRVIGRRVAQIEYGNDQGSKLDDQTAMTTGKTQNTST